MTYTVSKGESPEESPSLRSQRKCPYPTAIAYLSEYREYVDALELRRSLSPTTHKLAQVKTLKPDLLKKSVVYEVSVLIARKCMLRKPAET